MLGVTLRIFELDEFGVLWDFCTKVDLDWVKFHFTASSSAEYASRGKHVAKKLWSVEEDIVSDVYAVSENSYMP